MVDENRDMSYGEFVVERVREIIADVIMALPVDDGEDGTTEVIPFPATLLYGDDRRLPLIDSAVWAEWEVHLPDLVGRIGKEGVLLVMSALPDVGIPVQDPLFGMIADLTASFYARGYLIGMLEGADGSPPDDQMEEYLTAVQENVDLQIQQLHDLEQLFEDVSFEEETDEL